MIEIKGKYNEAKIFTDVVDSASIAQVQELCNQEFTAGSRIRLMPDIHAGAGCTIGTTMTITDKVVPNLVGVDIGCGMETTRIREGRLELQKLDKLIYEKIPSGFSIRDKAHRYLNEIDLSELCCARHVDLLRAEKSIGIGILPMRNIWHSWRPSARRSHMKFWNGAGQNGKTCISQARLL